MRKSQAPVLFDHKGRGWDLRESADENSPPPHAAVCGWGALPPLVRTVSPSMKRLADADALLPPEGGLPRRVLADVQNANECALKNEIRELEKRVANLNAVFEKVLTVNRVLVRENADLARRLTSA